LATLELELELADGRAPGAGRNPAAVERKLHLAVAYAQRHYDALHIRFEHGPQGPFELAGCEPRQRRGLDPLEIRLVGCDFRFPFVAAGLPIAPRLDALDPVAPDPADPQGDAGVAELAFPGVEIDRNDLVPLGGTARQVAQPWQSRGLAQCARRDSELQFDLGGHAADPPA